MNTSRTRQQASTLLKPSDLQPSSSHAAATTTTASSPMLTTKLSETGAEGEEEQAVRDLCAAANEALLHLSRVWSAARPYRAFSEDERENFAKTIDTALDVLLMALDDETYRFSFYLPAILNGCSSSREALAFEKKSKFYATLSEMVESSIRLREREIAEGNQDEEEAYGRHDIMTGRLLHHINSQIFDPDQEKDANSIKSAWSTVIPSRESGGLARFLRLLMRYFWTAHDEWFASDRTKQGWGVGRERALERFDGHNRHLAFQVFESACCGFFLSGRYISVTETQIIEAILDFSVVDTDGQVESHHIAMYECFCAPYITELLYKWDDEFVLYHMPKFFAVFPWLFEKNRDSYSILAKFFRFQSTNKNQKFFEKIVSSLVHCMDMVPLLVNHLRESCIRKYAISKKALMHTCHFAMKHSPMEFILQPDMAICLIDNAFYFETGMLNFNFVNNTIDKFIVCYSHLFSEEFDKGKQSILSDCYRFGAICPGIYAFLALLISQSDSIVLDGQDNALVDPRGFARHFKKTLGDDIVLELARKIRNHVQQLVTRELNEQLAKVEKRALPRSDAEKKKKKAKKTTKKQIEARVAEEDQFAWLQHRLRAFVTAYALLDEYIEREAMGLLREHCLLLGNKEEFTGNEKQNHAVWKRMANLQSSNYSQARRKRMQWPLYLSLAECPGIPNFEMEVQNDFNVLVLHIFEQNFDAFAMPAPTTQFSCNSSTNSISTATTSSTIASTTTNEAENATASQGEKSEGTAIVTATTANPSSESEESPSATVLSHKKVVSWHSKYLARMLASSMKEGSESTIRLTSVYPESLRKLLVALNEHVLSIESAEELVEMLYLADEYDMETVMDVLSEAFDTFPMPFSHAVSKDANGNTVITKEADVNEFACDLLPGFERKPEEIPPHERIPSTLITMENAPTFLAISADLGLKLEPKIFAGLCREWWEFGPRNRARSLQNRQKELDSFVQNCLLLSQCLDGCSSWGDLPRKTRYIAL